MFSIILDITLILLLAMIGVGGIIIYKKIGQLQTLHRDFQIALKTFDQVSGQTSQTLHALDQKANQAVNTLHKEIAKINPIKQDILFLCDRAEKAADNLMQPINHVTTPKTFTEINNKPSVRTRSERELVELITKRGA